MDIVEELQRQLAINNISYLKRIHDSGNNIMVQCPYHGNGQERRPSAGIHKETGVFHCFACQQSHTLPEVISYCFGKNDMFGEWGMKWLIKNFATVRKEERKDVELDMERNNTSNKDSVLDGSISNQSDSFISEEELDSYRYYHDYMFDRGLDDRVIELFDIGYDEKTQSITFPVRDISGRCLFVARRSVNKKSFNYPEGVMKPLYGLYELYHRNFRTNRDATLNVYRTQLLPDELYICESMIDCLLLWKHDKYAVALNGLGSRLQFQQLRDLPIRKYILATDNDRAGEMAREKIRQNVPRKIYTEIQFPMDIKDIGECSDSQLENIERWEIF